MACTTCKEKIEICDCPVENFTDCVKYRGDDLLAIELTEGESVKDALVNINEKLSSNNRLENIGTGARVFKTNNAINNLSQLRSVISVDESVTISENTNEIDLSVRNASELNTGIASIATQTEVQSATNDTKIITPLKLQSYLQDPQNINLATETQRGIIEIATQIETDAGTDTERAIVPSTLSTYVANTIADPSNLPNATEVARGIAEIATQFETDAGTDNEKIVTPAKLVSAVNTIVSNPNNLPTSSTTQRGVIEIATQAEVDASTDTERAIVPSTLSQYVSNATPNATQTQRGLIEIATQTEVTTGTDTERAVTPATLNQYTSTIVSNPNNLPNATETQRGVAEIATQVETDAGTDDQRFVTPLKLKNTLGLVGTPVTYLIQGKVTIGLIGFDPPGTTLTTLGDFTSSSIIDEGAGESTIQVNFPTIANANYQILITFYSEGVPFQDNDISHAIVSQTSSNFIVSVAGDDANEEASFIATLIPLNFTP